MFIAVVIAVGISASVSAEQASVAGIARMHQDLGQQYMRSGNMAKALEEFRNAATTDPSLLDAHLMVGSLLVKSGQFAEAAASYEKAVRIDKRRTDIHVALGDIYRQMNDTVTARRYYTSALALSPNQPHVVLSLAQIAMKSGSYAEAVSLLEGVSSFAGDPGAMAMRAYAYHRLGQLDAAAVLYRKVLALDPDNGDIHLNLGILEAARGNPAGAADEFSRAIIFVSDKASTYRYLGLVQLDLGRFDDAAQSLRRAVGLNPNDIVARFKLAGILIKIGQPGEAIVQLEAIRASSGPNRDYRELRPMLGRAYLDAGQASKARPELERAYQENPSDTIIIAALAITYQRLGETRLAIDFYEKILAMRSAGTDIYRSLADLYASTGNATKAIEFERIYRDLSSRDDIKNAVEAERALSERRLAEVRAAADRRVAESDAEAARKIEAALSSFQSRSKEIEMKSAQTLERMRAESDSNIRQIESLAKRQIDEMRRLQAQAVDSEIARVSGARLDKIAALEQENQRLRAKASLRTEATSTDTQPVDARIVALEQENQRLRARASVRLEAASTDTPSGDAAELEIGRIRKEADARVAAARKEADEFVRSANQRLRAKASLRLDADSSDTQTREATALEIARIRKDADARVAVARKEADEFVRRESERIRGASDTSGASSELISVNARLSAATKSGDEARSELLSVNARLSAATKSGDEARKMLASADTKAADEVRKKLAEVSVGIERERAIREEAVASAERVRAQSELAVREMKTALDAVNAEMERGLKDIGADTAKIAGDRTIDRLKYYVQNVRLSADARVARSQLAAEGRLNEVRNRTESEVVQIMRTAQAQVDRARVQAAEEVRRAQMSADSELIRKVDQERERLAGEALAKRLALAEQLRASIEADAQVRFLEDKARIEATYEADRIRQQRDYDNQLAKFESEYQRRLEALQMEARHATEQVAALTRNDTSLLMRSEVYQRIVRENAMLREDLAGGRRRLEELGRDKEQLIKEADELRREIANVQGRLGTLEAETRRYQGIAVLAEPLQRGVNINIASLDELQALPGIGVQEARNIIWYRENVGPFRGLEELAKVPGLEAVKASSIRGLIKIR